MSHVPLVMIISPQITIDKNMKICYYVFMVQKNETTTDATENRPARRAGLIQRLGYSAGFIEDRPRGEIGYSRREKIVLGVAGLVIATASIVGIKAAGDRVSDHLDGDGTEQIDTNPDSDK